MIYVMSDLHGCLKHFKFALKKINFSSKDTLFVLGDIVDRGKDPCLLLLEMMKYDNIIPILGNHEYMALSILEKFAVEIQEDNINSLKEEDFEAYYNYITNGGSTTINQFLTLDREKQEMIIDYLKEFSLYEMLEVSGRKYLLLHGGLANFEKHKRIENYQVEDIIFYSPTLDDYYFDSIYTIIGHTPNFVYSKETIFSHHHIIHIDCGLVYGHSLGILCLDNLKTYYIPFKTA